MREPSDPHGTTGTVRPAEDPGAGAARSRLPRKLVRQQARPSADPPARDRGRRGQEVPASRDQARPADPPARDRGRRGQEVPASRDQARPADPSMRAIFSDVISETGKLIRFCIATVVLTGCLIVVAGALGYLAEHMHSALAITITKGGAIISITAAGTMTVAVSAGLIAAGGRSRRARKKREKGADRDDGPKFELQG